MAFRRIAIRRHGRNPRPSPSQTISVKGRHRRRYRGTAPVPTGRRQDPCPARPNLVIYEFCLQLRVALNVRRRPDHVPSIAVTNVVRLAPENSPARIHPHGGSLEQTRAIQVSALARSTPTSGSSRWHDEHLNVPLRRPERRTPQRFDSSLRPIERAWPLPAPDGRRVSGSRTAEADERVRCTRMLGGLSRHIPAHPVDRPVQTSADMAQVQDGVHIDEHLCQHEPGRDLPHAVQHSEHHNGIKRTAAQK